MLRGKFTILKTIHSTNQKNYHTPTPSNPQITQFKFTLIPTITPDQYCPSCLTRHEEFIEDDIRAEAICPKCKTVIAMAYPWVAGRRVQNPSTYSFKEPIYK